jgi:hypothetical protein
LVPFKGASHVSSTRSHQIVGGKPARQPIEQEVNGVEDMLYMYSQATSDGGLNLTVTFKQGTNLDKAQLLVQNRVALAVPRLPQPVQRNGVSVKKSSPTILSGSSCSRPTALTISFSSRTSRCGAWWTCSSASTAWETSSFSASANIQCAFG